MNTVITYLPLKKIFIVFSIFLLVFFYDYFLDYLSYVDELLAVVFAVLLIFTKKIKLLRVEYTIIGLLFFILFIGLLSNTVTVQKIVPRAIGLDILSFFKAFVVYFGVRVLFKDVTYYMVLPSLKKIALWGLLFLIIFILVDITFDIFPKGNRFGLSPIELFFKHPSRLSFAISFIFIVLYPYFINKAKYFLLLILLVGIVTLRFKYFGFVLVVLFFIFNKSVFLRINKKYIYIIFGFLLVTLFVVFKDWIMQYFSFQSVKTGWSRAVLLKYSFIVSRDFFPLGTGFGSFASYFSGPDYSWVYKHYGIHTIWGIQKKYYHFLGDQYWPMILGQFGVFGLLAMFGVIASYINILLSYFKLVKDEFLKNAIIAGFFGLILLLIDSSSDAIFSQNRGVVIFMLLALIINTIPKNYNENVTKK